MRVNAKLYHMNNPHVRTHFFIEYETTDIPRDGDPAIFIGTLHESPAGDEQRAIALSHGGVESLHDFLGLYLKSTTPENR